MFRRNKNKNLFSRIKSYHWNGKMFYWNKIIPLKQMEKSVPPELFGRGKKKKKEIFLYDAVLKNILVIIWDNYFGLTPPVIETNCSTRTK